MMRGIPAHVSYAAYARELVKVDYLVDSGLLPPVVGPCGNSCCSMRRHTWTLEFCTFIVFLRYVAHI